MAKSHTKSLTTVIDLFSPRDAGRLLGLTSAGVIKLALRGKLPELRDSAGRRLFRREDLERVLAERAKRPKQTMPRLPVTNFTLQACVCGKIRHPHDPAEHNPSPDYGF